MNRSKDKIKEKVFPHKTKFEQSTKASVQFEFPKASLSFKKAHHETLLPEYDSRGSCRYYYCPQ